MSEEYIRLVARVEGRVQGVGFRYFVRREATALRITGWVMNEADRSVRLVAEGPASSVDRLVERLHAGPPGSRVLRVTTERHAATGAYARFSIER